MIVQVVVFTTAALALLLFTYFHPGVRSLRRSARAGPAPPEGVVDFEEVRRRAGGG